MKRLSQETKRICTAGWPRFERFSFHFCTSSWKNSGMVPAPAIHVCMQGCMHPCQLVSLYVCINVFSFACMHVCLCVCNYCIHASVHACARDVLFCTQTRPPKHSQYMRTQATPVMVSEGPSFSCRLICWMLGRSRGILGKAKWFCIACTQRRTA